MGFPSDSVIRNLPASVGDARDMALIPGSGRSPGEGTGYMLEYSCLDNSKDRGAWWATVHGVAESDMIVYMQACTHYISRDPWFPTLLQLQWIIIHCSHLFWCSYCPWFGHESLCQLTLSFWLAPIILWAPVCFLSQDVLRVTLFFSSFSLESGISPKSPYSSQRTMVFKKLSTGHWSYHCSQVPSMDRAGECMYLHNFIYLNWIHIIPPIPISHHRLILVIFLFYVG